MPVNLNGMDPRVLSALRKIQADAAARGIQTNVISGVRSLEDQKTLRELHRWPAGAAASLPVQRRGPARRDARNLRAREGPRVRSASIRPVQASRALELAPAVGLRTIGSSDPNHFELASDSQPSQSSTSSNPVYSGLIARGFSAPQAYALMGNMQQESNFNPSAFNEKEGALGLLQWRQDRRANLQSFAASQGKPANDLNTQLDFIKYETTKGAEAGNAAAFYAANDVGSANAALKKYIRYGDDSEGTRLANAQAYAGGKTPSGGSGGGTSVATGANDPNWQSLLGVPKIRATSRLGSMMSDAVGPASAPRAPASSLSPIEPEPQIDQSFALASPTEQELGARYEQGKATRKLSPLGQLFSLPTIGPQQVKPATGPPPYTNLGVG